MYKTIKSINHNFIPFSKTKINRQSGHRDNIEDFLEHKNAKFYIFHNSNPLVSFENEIYILIGFDKSILKAINDYQLIFIGTIDDEPIFIISSNNIDFNDNDLFANHEFKEIRSIYNNISDTELNIISISRSIIEWHNRHGYCSNCGTKSNITQNGWRRDCPNCKTEHFPRTDPVVIMLVIYEDKCLLGRSAHFPEGLYSHLAGFAEPGESLEEACKREVFEESGIIIKSASIIANQPWPFPYQLMIGMLAYAENNQIILDKNELEDAAWFTKTEVKALLNEGIEHNGKNIIGPHRIAIAHHLLRYWLKDNA